MPNSNYKDKYAHLIGQDAALEAAKKTETNKSYGFGNLFTTYYCVLCILQYFVVVPSENKKDCRSIEQTMADIKAKRKLKEKQSASSSEN